MGTKISGYEQHFVDWLKEHHSGKFNAIRAKDMKSWGTLPEIRAIVNLLRNNGVPICSDSNGYYYATNSREIEITMNHLKSRAKEIQKACDGLSDVYYDLKHAEVMRARTNR